MRSPLVGVLLVASLAGCVSAPPAAAPPGDPADGAAAVLPWTMTECRYIVGFTPVEEAALAPHIPEGFRLEPRPMAGGILLERVSLGVEAFSCARGAGLDGEVERLEYGSVFVTVLPPDEMAQDGSDFHMLKWDILVPDAPRREALLAAGLPVHAGAATVEDLPHGGRRGTLTLDGVGTFVLDLVAPQSNPAPDGAPRFTEFTPASGGGFAAWRANFAWDSDTIVGGRGTIAWPEGSWAADVVGTSPAPSTFHAGTWSFSNGTLTLPTR